MFHFRKDPRRNEGAIERKAFSGGIVQTVDRELVHLNEKGLPGVHAVVNIPAVVVDIILLARGENGIVVVDAPAGLVVRFVYVQLAVEILKGGPDIAQRSSSHDIRCK